MKVIACCHLLIVIAAAAIMPSFVSPSTDEIAENTKQELAKFFAGEDEDGSAKPIVTKGNAAVFATSDILTVASRNMDASKVIDAAMKVVFDPNASKTAQTKAKLDLENVQQYLQHSSTSLNAAALHSAPMAGFKREHEQAERQKRSDAKAAIAKEEKKKKKNQPKKLPEALMLEDYVEMAKGEGAPAPLQAVSPEEDIRVTRSVHSKKAKELAVDPSQLPKPKDGKHYSKPELVEVIKSIMDAHADKKIFQIDVIKAIIASNYVPIGQKTIERLMKKDRDGEIILDEPWLPSQGGKQKAVPDHVVAEKAAVLREGNNEGFDMQDTVKHMIMDHRAKLQEEAGLVADPKAPSQSTVDKYCVSMAKAGVAIVDNVMSKTENRSTNEKSQRGPISNVGIVSATQFEVMDEEDHELNKELESASIRTRALYELTRRARGGAPIWAVKPQLLFSTDDTTTFIFDGKDGKKGKWVFASDTAVKNRGTSSIYRQEKVNIMNGLRVKVTFTFSAAGMTAPLFITISGVSEDEMPDEEFLHVQVPGLAVGGAGVTVGNKTMGHIFFMRKGKGADEERVKYYQDQVLLPWIEEVRKDIDSNYVTGMKVPTKLKAVSWMDGALDQVASLADNPEKFAKAWITVCKQNPGRTAVEQPADLAPVFKLFKQYVANTSSLDQHVTNLFRD